jgi:N-acetylmuramoyl-L-alanine amidase
MTVLTCALLIALAGGCTPPPSSPLREEKEPYVVQGMSRESALDFSGAIESYHRALEVNPRNSIAHYHLGLLYEDEDRNPAAAIYHFQCFLKLRPNSEQAALLGQRIIGCKQALARDVALGPVSGEMQQQLEELSRTNQKLSEEAQRLAQENLRLKEQLASLQGRPLPRTSERSSTAVASPAQPQPAPTAPPGATPRTHTVQKGDTYYSIATRYRISPASLEAANPGINPRQLKIGQRLVVPTR